MATGKRLLSALYIFFHSPTDTHCESLAHTDPKRKAIIHGSGHGSDIPQIPKDHSSAHYWSITIRASMIPGNTQSPA
eukprot:746198-Amphidinium_carterae.1